MELQDIVAISGKPGLFKVLKPTRNGVILETLDEQKKKLVATGHHHRVSALHAISIYTLDNEGSRAGCYDFLGRPSELRSTVALQAREDGLAPPGEQNQE